MAPEEYLSAEEFYKELYHDLNYADIDHPVLLINSFINKLRSSTRFYQLKPGCLHPQQIAEIAARWAEAIQDVACNAAKKND